MMDDDTASSELESQQISEPKNLETSASHLKPQNDQSPLQPSISKYRHTQDDELPDTQPNAFEENSISGNYYEGSPTQLITIHPFMDAQNGQDKLDQSPDDDPIIAAAQDPTQVDEVATLNSDICSPDAQVTTQNCHSPATEATLPSHWTTPIPSYFTASKIVSSLPPKHESSDAFNDSFTEPRLPDDVGSSDKNKETARRQKASRHWEYDEESEPEFPLSSAIDASILKDVAPSAQDAFPPALRFHTSSMLDSAAKCKVSSLSSKGNPPDSDSIDFDSQKSEGLIGIDGDLSTRHSSPFMSFELKRSFGELISSYDDTQSTQEVGSQYAIGSLPSLKELRSKSNVPPSASTTQESIENTSSDLHSTACCAAPEKEPLNKLSCRERKRIATSYNRPPALTKAMKLWIAKTHKLLDPFREDDDCWFHPSPPRARPNAAGTLKPCGKLQKRFTWQDHRAKHSLVLNYGIVSKIINYKMTKQQKDGFINKQWHLSHLCGNWTCLNPEHTTVEPGKVNISRNNCFSHRSGCTHDPKCMKEKKVLLSPHGIPVNQHIIEHAAITSQKSSQNWDDWSMQSFDDGEISVLVDDEDGMEMEFALEEEDEDEDEDENDFVPTETVLET